MPDRDTCKIMRLCEVRLRHDPTDPDALFAKAAVFARLGLYGEALQCLDTIPQGSGHYPGLGRFREKLVREMSRSGRVHLGWLKGDEPD